MDAKSLSKVVLFSVGIIAMNIGSAFAWKCSLGHEHKQDEMCTDMGERPCDACKNGSYPRWELCSQTIFPIPSENCKYVALPSHIPNEQIALLLIKYKYDEGGKEIKHIDPFLLGNDAIEINRLSCCVHALEKKYLPEKVEDKKEGHENRKSGAEDVWDSSNGYDAEESMNLMEESLEISRKKRKRLRKFKNEGGLSEQKRLKRIQEKNYKLLKKLYLDDEAKEVKLGKKKKKK